MAWIFKTVCKKENHPFGWFGLRLHVSFNDTCNFLHKNPFTEVTIGETVYYWVFKVIDDFEFVDYAEFFNAF